MRELATLIETTQRHVTQMENLLDVAEAVRVNVNPLMTLQQGGGIVEAVRPSLELFNKLSRQWESIMSPVFAQLGEALRYGELSTRFCAIMLELGWPPPLGLPASIMEEILHDYDEHGAGVAGPKAERLLLEHYDAEVVGDMLGEWGQNPLLARRLTVLRQVVLAHQGCQYALSVPTILAQIEGLIADGFKHHGRMSVSDYKAYVEKLLESENAVMTDPMAKEFILKTVLVSFQHGEAIPSSLSRHAILHGADSEYGTATNSLKALLLFSYLAASFGAEEEN